MLVFYTYPDANYPDPNVNYNTGLIGGTSYNQAQAILNTPSPSFGSQLADVAKAAAPIAAIAAAPFTGGASLAIGEAILGVGAVGAATLGAAIVGSASSAVAASLTGGDVTKSAITGAITGGVGANATNIAATLVGGGDSIAGISTINDIATSTGLTTTQVANSITNAVTSGVVTAAVTGGDVGTAVASSLASSGISAEVQNTITDNLPDMTSTAKLVGNVAGVATRAAVSGTDVGTAIQNNIGQIIGGQLQDTTKTDTKKEVSQTDTADTGTAVVVQSDPANNSALVINTNGDVNIVATTGDIASGSTVKIDPTTNVATVANAATTGTTFAPTASTDTTPLVKQPDSSVTLGDLTVLPGTEQTGQFIVDANSPTGFSDASGKPINADGTPYTQETVEITPTVIPKDITTTPEQPTQTQQILDLINQPVTTGTATETTIGTTTPATGESTLPTTTPTLPGVGDVNIPATTEVKEEITPTTVTQTETIPTAPELPEIVVEADAPKKEEIAETTPETITPDKSKDVTKQPTTTPALTSILSPSIIPSKASGTASRGFGPSGAYLGQALGTTSPDSGLTGGPPVLSGEEGKKRNVWNVESLRNALGI